MILKKMLAATLVSLIIIFIQILMNLVIIFVFEESFFDLFGLFFLLPTYIVFIFLYGVPASILIEFISRKLKNSKIYSFFLYLIFSAVFLPIFFIINPFGSNLSFLELLKGSISLLCVSIFFSIAFWYIDLKIDVIRCHYHKKIELLKKEND